MATTDLANISVPDGPRFPRLGLATRSTRLRTLLAKARDSNYQRVGNGRPFRAHQRTNTRNAARIGLLVVAPAVAFDAVALLDLDSAGTQFAIAIDLAVIGVIVIGWWSLGGWLRHHPELVAWAATIGVAVSTVSTGTLVPGLAVQTVGYLLLIPGLVALLLPWRTQTHVRWLMAYAVVGLAYLAQGDLGRFSDTERGDLVIVFAVALGASLAGHVLLQRSLITNFVQMGRITRLRRKSENDILELERLQVERDEFFEMSLDMLVVMGSDGRFRRVNRAWVDTFGFAATEIIGRPWRDFIHPEDLERTIAEAQRNLGVGARTLNFANRYRCADGTYRWLEWVSRKAATESSAFAVARDVTERRRVDDRRLVQKRALEARNTRLTKRAARDPLTSLLNRRSFESEVSRLGRSWQRLPVDQRPPVAVVLFDLDKFGEVNKAHGHQAGDAVLVRFAEILVQRFRESDLVVRYGGEEFVAILPGATSADAIRIADDIRETFAGVPIDIGGGTSILVTVSAGCAALDDDRLVAKGMSVADVWLSQAKRSGRNQVIGL